MIEFLITLLIIALLLSIWICRILYKKVSTYEEWIYDASKSVHTTWENMRELDQRKMFESDDEVGVIFNELKLLIDDLNEKIGEDLYASEENDEESY